MKEVIDDLTGQPIPEGAKNFGGGVNTFVVDKEKGVEIQVSAYLGNSTAIDIGPDGLAQALQTVAKNILAPAASAEQVAGK